VLKIKFLAQMVLLENLVPKALVALLQLLEMKSYFRAPGFAHWLLAAGH